MLKRGDKSHGWKLCIGALWMMLAAIPVFSRAQTPDIDLTVYRDLVRFTAPGEAQAWRVEVFSPSGEKLFDSDFVIGQALDWRLSDQSDQTLESGLYAYTITIKDPSGNVSRAHQGNMIIDQTREGLEMAPPLNSSPAGHSPGKWDVDQATKVHTINTLAMGIGTRTPLARLHVGAGAVAPITAGSTLLVSEGAATGMALKSTTGAEMFFYQDHRHGLLGTASAHPLGIRTNNLNRLWIARDGNIGIHTMNPGSPLTVAGMIEVTSGGIKFPDGTIQTTAVNDGYADGVGATPSRKKSDPTIPGFGLVVTRLNGLFNKVNLVAGPGIAISTSLPTNTLTISATGGSGGGGVTAVTASAPLASSGGASPNLSLTGIVAVANGGTGLSSAGASGSYLRSNGSSWTRSAILAADLPDLGNSYIKNATTLQASSNFSISGNGTLGGVLSANTVNAVTQYNINGIRVLSNAGTQNLFAGATAGSSNRGSFNAFFGSTAGSFNTTGGGNAFFGAFAGAANTAGSFNSFFGSRAGVSNTMGNANAFFGTNAGAANTMGSSNAFFGVSAGAANTTGSFNAFFGSSAGFSNTTGINNNFFGFEAGENNTTGSNNAFFGYRSGQANTTGGSNSFFGAFAGNSNTTGNVNSFFGVSAGSANTTGNSNAFFGDGAGGRNTTGSSNTFIGQVAGSSNTIGDANAFFGYGAGGRNTIGAGNTFVGLDTGFSNTTENNNTFIGIFANGAAGITNATAIGARASVTVSNAVVLGSGVNVGIGTTAPKSKLHIAGGDAFIAQPNSLIITSPNGSCWQIRVSDSGGLSATSVSCPN